MAVWKEIAGYEGRYLVSDEGQILSLPREVSNSKGHFTCSGRILKPWPRLAWIIVFCLGGYALFGWYALLGTLVMILPSNSKRSMVNGQRLMVNGQRSMVKNAIKREQSRTCSSYAEREHFRRSQCSMFNGNKAKN
jgi:hypothetical protein